MDKFDAPLKCYIAVLSNPQVDWSLEKNGFSRRLLIFGIPDYGILFRCRAEGAMLDLEFMAFFSLLEFIKSSMKKEEIGAIQVISSNPEFVFSFKKNSRYMPDHSVRRKLLTEMSQQFQIGVGYTEPVNNKALLPPAHYPSMPSGSKLVLENSEEKFGKSSFEPFVKGVKL